jgi:hypothetical protein
MQAKNSTMKNHKRYVIAALALIGSTWLSYGREATGYDLTLPDNVYTLPEDLREISGLAYLEPAMFVCVQDEHGILYTYNPATNRTATNNFGADGDYEDLARVGQTVYVLRSDGCLFEVINFSSETAKVISYETGIPARDNEGLCYDAAGHRLLIAPKSASGKGAEFKDKRMVYAFDLKTKSLQQEPAFTLDLKEIAQFAQNAGITLETKKTKKVKIVSPVIHLKPSAMAIHPITGQLYLLSAVSRHLLVFDPNGTIRDIEQLDAELFNKAEGITFNEKGDLFIANEGQDKPATILRFNVK